MPDQPAGPDRSHPHFSSSGRFPASPSEPPTSSSISSKSRTPHPQSFEPEQKRKSSPLPFVVAALGLSAAAAAVWFVNNQQPAPLPASGAQAAATAPDGSKPKESQYTQEPGAWGVNINSIPLDSNEPAGATPGKPGHAAPGKPAETSVHSARPGKPEKEDPKADKAKDEKADKAEKEPAPPQEPELEAPPTEKPPPPDQRTPLNRASALTSLSKAANSAMSCKRDGGPSGSGTASVTFSTEGPVSAVSLSAPFAGTPVGNCIQTVFRSAHVPAFSGSSVTLSKSFRIPE